MLQVRTKNSQGVAGDRRGKAGRSVPRGSSGSAYVPRRVGLAVRVNGSGPFAVWGRAGMRVHDEQSRVDDRYQGGKGGMRGPHDSCGHVRRERRRERRTSRQRRRQQPLECSRTGTLGLAGGCSATASSSLGGTRRQRLSPARRRRIRPQRRRRVAYNRAGERRVRGGEVLKKPRPRWHMRRRSQRPQACRASPRFRCACGGHSRRRRHTRNLRRRVDGRCAHRAQTSSART